MLTRGAAGCLPHIFDNQPSRRDNLVFVTPNRMTSYEYKNKTYKVDVPAGHTLQNVLEPAYWAHVANRLNTGDELVVVSEDNIWRAHLYVIDRGVGWVNVYCLKFDELDSPFEMPVNADTNYIIEHSGNYHKWRVRRRSDDHVLVSQQPTRAKAVDWLKNYQATLMRDKDKELDKVKVA